MSAARDLRRFRAAEWIVGKLLYAMAKWATRRYDLHETRHIIAQLHAGESVNCGSDCPLRRVSPVPYPGGER